MMRTIRLSISLAERAIEDKAFMEALAFALLSKQRFVSSRTHKATIARCKELFHIGSDKMGRILRNGVKFGLLRREGKDIIANKIRVSSTYEIKIPFHNDRVYTIQEMENHIRQSVLANRISCQNQLEQTAKLASGEIYPHSSRQYKKAKKLSQGLALKAGEDYEGFSMQKVASVCNVSKPTARKLLNDMVQKGVVHKRKRIKTVSKVWSGFNRERDNFYHKEAGQDGYLFVKNDEVRCRLSDKLTFNESLNLIEYKND